ncbi:olfactory receptor 2D3-like [Hemicordylus capensis]|uniref:olfactory receptor 2D3-like n=1 Tax=Hemicordylus capensis TaxID=884348 RepID=UPI0023026C45|nr:olfactory receptor 2D3-like [Hemicordylus capensis]
MDLDHENDTLPENFILTGLSRQPWVREVLFVIFLLLYLVTISGNGLIVVLIIMDSHLHTPMYFFLGNLSFIDVCYCTTSVPQMLVHCFQEPATISYARCIAQMCSSLFLGMTECILLAVMAYDRFVAICSPLHYTLIMSRKVCIALASCSWVTVVGIFFGTAIAMYTQPQTKFVSESDKFVSIFYGVITPMLNPLIYSLRNKDVKAALYRMIGRETKT